jgi:hypothetical protein
VYNAAMPLPQDADAAYWQLMEINRSAYAAGAFAVAFHAAMGAAHAAEDAQNVGQLRQLETLLIEQRDRIDKEHANHSLSHRTARSHGHQGVFHVGVAQVHSMIQRMEIDARQKELVHGWRPVAGR